MSAETMNAQKLMRSLSTRAVKKVEKPRPLKSPVTHTKSSDGQCNSLEEVMSLVQSMSQSIVQKNLGPDFGLQSANLMSKLKMFGPRLEESFEAQLDKAFLNFRTAASSDDIDQTARLNLLHLIELRSMQWQSTPAMHSYYVFKSNNASESFDIMDTLATPPHFANSILNPGEVIKSSGKFTSPTKVPGKNYCKDEIVIRNADSGKVSPGAKERLVQITGPEEEKIVLAKQLIEETIKRNASPIRELEKDIGSNSSLNSSVSEDILNLGPDNVYNFSVMSGDDGSMSIIGQDLELLKAAKLVLEMYLPKSRSELLRFLEKMRISQNNNEQDFYNVPVFNEEQISKANYLREPSPKSLDIHPRENIKHMKESPPKYAKSQDSIKSTKESPPKDAKISDLENNNEVELPAPQPVKKLSKSAPVDKSLAVEYTRHFLMDCSSSKASIKVPADWDNICANFPDIVKEGSPLFDAETYLKQWNSQNRKSTVSESENTV